MTESARFTVLSITACATRMAPAALAALCLLFGACSKPAPTTAEKSAEKPAATQADSEKAQGEGEKVKEGSEGVTLTAEQNEKLGVTTQPAQAIQYREEAPGYGIVLEHEVIAQALADLRTAQATAHFSKASLERARQLRGTPGALSADVEQTAEQKASVDSAALMLTTAKLSSAWGVQPPWKDDLQDPRLQALAGGSLQLARVTFPLGTVSGIPDELRAGRVGTNPTDAAATLRPVWAAHADPNIPGRSFFALLKPGTVAEGERLQVWSPVGEPTAGVLIPISAMVMSDGRYWCYVQKDPGKFVRVEIDTNRPTSGGYVVTDGVKPGDRIAVTAVGQLLAKETGSSEEPD